jgi:hypothetical protein
MKKHSPDRPMTLGAKFSRLITWDKRKRRKSKGEDDNFWYAFGIAFLNFFFIFFATESFLASRVSRMLLALVVLSMSVWIFYRMRRTNSFGTVFGDKE